MASPLARAARQLILRHVLDRGIPRLERTDVTLVQVEADGINRQQLVAATASGSPTYPRPMTPMVHDPESMRSSRDGTGCGSSSLTDAILRDAEVPEGSGEERTHLCPRQLRVRAVPVVCRRVAAPRDASGRQPIDVALEHGVVVIDEPITLARVGQTTRHER